MLLIQIYCEYFLVQDFIKAFKPISRCFHLKCKKRCYVSQLDVVGLCRSWDEVHGQDVLVFHWLL